MGSHIRTCLVFLKQKYQCILGGTTIEYVEKIHNCAMEWVLETPHGLEKNHHLHDKMGYVKTGKTEKINDKLTIEHFKKEISNQIETILEFKK